MKFVDVYDWDEEKVQYVPKVLVNGTTTICFGVGMPNIELTEELFSLGKMLYEQDTHFGPESYSNDIYTKGVAKLSPNDTFDARTGVKVASRKAEYKAKHQQLMKYKKILKRLDKARMNMVKEMTTLEGRLASIEEELERVNKQ